MIALKVEVPGIAETTFLVEIPACLQRLSIIRAIFCISSLESLCESPAGIGAEPNDFKIYFEPDKLS